MDDSCYQYAKAYLREKGTLQSDLDLRLKRNAHNKVPSPLLCKKHVFQQLGMVPSTLAHGQIEEAMAWAQDDLNQTPRISDMNLLGHF